MLTRLTGDRKRGLRAAVKAPTTRIRTRRPSSFFCIGCLLLSRLADGELQHVVLAELGALEEAR